MYEAFSAFRCKRGAWAIAGVASWADIELCSAQQFKNHVHQEPEAQPVFLMALDLDEGALRIAAAFENEPQSVFPDNSELAGQVTRDRWGGNNSLFQLKTCLCYTAIGKGTFVHA